MYNKIVNWFSKLYTTASADIWLYVTGAVFALLLIFNIAFVIAICVRKKRKCACKIVQLNHIRHVISCFFAYLTLFVGLPALILNGPAARVTVADLMVLLGFLAIFHILEFVFMMISKSKKGCCGCVAEKKEESAEERVTESVGGMIPPTPPATEIAQSVSISSLVGGVEGGVTPTSEIKSTRTRRTAAQVAAETTGAVVAPKAPIERTTIVSEPARLAPKPRTAPTRAPSRMPAKITPARPAPVVKRTVEEIAAERRNERIGELGAKIERQRNRAEKTTDAMQIEDEAYTQRTREAHATAADTASRMDELQRRMDMLRQKAPLQTTTERVVREDVVREERRDEVVRRDDRRETMRVTGGVVSRQTTIEEMKREREGLRRQYEMLQNKLLQMKSEQRESVSVGFNTTPSNFERTGKTEALAKIPTRNKFDEEEVNAALLGLRKAMDDLQRQIDARDE